MPLRCYSIVHSANTLCLQCGQQFNEFMYTVPINLYLFYYMKKKFNKRKEKKSKKKKKIKLKIFDSPARPKNSRFGWKWDLIALSLAAKPNPVELFD